MARSLGLTRSQARGVVFVEATTIAVVALLIGAPIGGALGRTTWDAFVERLGIDGPTGIDWTRLGGLVIVVLVLTWMIAIIPSLIATRHAPSRYLREQS